MENSKKPLYDTSIEFDISILPKYVQDIIKALEKASDEGDWMSYDCEFDCLEPQLKTLVITNKLSQEDFDTLERKYGWYCD